MSGYNSDMQITLGLVLNGHSALFEPTSVAPPKVDPSSGLIGVGNHHSWQRPTRFIWPRDRFVLALTRLASLGPPSPGAGEGKLTEVGDPLRKPI